MCLVWPPCVIKPHVFHVPNGEQARDMRAYLEWSVSAFCGLKPLERPGAPQTILLGAEEKQQLQLQRWWRWESGEKTNVCWFHMVTAWRTCNPCVRTKWISHTVNLSVSTTYTNPFMQPLQGGNAAPLFLPRFFFLPLSRQRPHWRLCKKWELSGRDTRYMRLCITIYVQHWTDGSVMTGLL